MESQCHLLLNPGPDISLKGILFLSINPVKHIAVRKAICFVWRRYQLTGSIGDGVRPPVEFL